MGTYGSAPAVREQLWTVYLQKGFVVTFQQCQKYVVQLACRLLSVNRVHKVSEVTQAFPTPRRHVQTER